MASPHDNPSLPATLRVFVSSVQRELEDERLIVQNLLTTDPFLAAHCLPVLYEFEPASPGKALDECLLTLDGCQVYVLVVGAEYGTSVGDVSITHAEYRRAKEAHLPVLAFIKGDRHVQREEGTTGLLAEIDADGLKYKRFGNVVELQKEVRSALLRLLLETFGIAPTSDENESAAQTIEATSAFESQRLDRIRWQDLDHAIAKQMLAAAEQRKGDEIPADELLAGAVVRGLAWHDPTSGNHFATAAGILLLARDPSAVFPQCRILADAYRGTELDSQPRDHEDIRGALPVAVERALAFVDRNTRHPMRIVGINRIRVDEYPAAALREAVVNAVAHRQYEDAGRKILLEVFCDRVVVSSPGLPPAPITLANLRRGRYRPCSRNPVIAQCLSWFHRIEERGSGFRRMTTQMTEHGLTQPLLATDTGYFQVTFPGPGNAIDRIHTPKVEPDVAPTIAARLSDRQRRILTKVFRSGMVTRRSCATEFGVSIATAGRDLMALVNLGLLAAKGRGRSAGYVCTPRRSRG